jgi:hypothetical protein
MVRILLILTCFVSFRIQIIAEGKKRKLIIKNCKLDDGGMISAKTNADEVSAPLEVNCELTFINAFNSISQILYFFIGKFHSEEQVDINFPL